MKKLIAIALMLPAVASAECYMRSATVKDSKQAITRIADIQRSVVPVNREQFKCVVAFRVEINSVWHTAEGASVGANSDSMDQVCSQALDSGRSYVLQKVGGATMKSEQEMVCRDDPLPEVKSTKIGEVVKISELAPHPQKPDFFDYKGAKCRWFVESDFDPVRRDVMQWQGIACLLRKGEWQVVDKF
jgi:hypothetical protein